MKIIDIALKDLLITLKDKKAMALIVLMPILLIIVLGVSLSSMFNQGSSVSIKKFPLALVDKDGGEYAKNFKEFLDSEDIKKMIEVKDLSFEAAIDNVKKGDIPAAIIIPEGYSSAVQKGNRAELQILKDPGSPLKTQVVESLVKSYTGVGSAITGSVDAAVKTFAEYNADPNMVIGDIIKFSQNININLNEDNVKKKDTMSSMQYYAAAMLAMYILFVGMLGTSSIIEEREQKTLMRLMSAAVSKSQILAGKVLGLFMLGIFDVSILILFTKFVFNVNWGNSIGGLVVLSLSMIFAASGLSMLIASLFKTSKAVMAANPAIVIVMSLLGGSMLPVYIMPPVLQDIAKITLNNWALKGYLSLMLNNGFDTIVMPSIVLLAMGIVFLAAGIFRLRLE